MATRELFREDSYLTSCEAMVRSVSAEGVSLEQTVFYPTGGGQPGDVGVLELVDGTRLEVTDTRKGADGEILHVVGDESLESLVGQIVVASIDWERRHRLMRMHTCMHLLCSVVVGGVTGGSIRDGSARLDFDLPEVLLDKEQITEALNALVRADHLVSARWVDEAELDAKPELVRTMSVQPPRGSGRIRLLDIAGIDLQPCGGTHVARTGEIGRVRVKKIEKKGKHNRRVNVAFDESS
jgi:misacylated tRNA(Ala) deacylase